MKKMLAELQDTPTDSVRYNELVKAITANFDEFKENSSHNIFNKDTARHGSDPHHHHPAGGAGGKHSAGHNAGHNNAMPSPVEGAASKQDADAAFLNYTYKRKTVSVLLCVATTRCSMYAVSSEKSHIHCCFVAPNKHVLG